MSPRNIFTAAALSFVALNAVPAAAHHSASHGASGTMPVTVQVETGGLNLASAKGQRALDAELKGAVRDVCGVHPPIRDLHEVRSYRSCVTDAKASFMEERSIAIAQAQDASRVAVNGSSRTAG